MFQVVLSIEDFQSRKKQWALGDSDESPMANVISVVPLGSVIESTLFWCYINDLPEITKCIVRLFADDIRAVYMGFEVVGPSGVGAGEVQFWDIPGYFEKKIDKKLATEILGLQGGTSSFPYCDRYLELKKIGEQFEQCSEAVCSSLAQGMF